MNYEDAVERRAADLGVPAEALSVCGEGYVRTCPAENCREVTAYMQQPFDFDKGALDSAMLKHAREEDRSIIAALDAAAEAGLGEGPLTKTATQIAADMNASVLPTRGALPDDDKLRGEYPMAEGLLYYFPAALAEVARVSKIGNDQHNPGEPLHWARGKSTDHENKILRHLTEAGTKDSKGVRHTARLAWRALALLQIELETQEGAPRPRNAY